MLEKYLDSLITRMLDRSDELTEPYESDKTITWKALREAEKLSDHKYIDNIIENIDTEKDKKRRDYMYFIVGKNCENKPYQKGLEFLIDRLYKETDKYIISAMLNRIEWLHKSAETDLTKIYNCLQHKTWQVRHSAINALKNTNNFVVEVLMIQIMENATTEKYEIIYPLDVLYNCGSEKCILYVEKQLQHKSRNIKVQAKETIKAIKERFRN